MRHMRAPCVTKGFTWPINPLFTEPRAHAMLGVLRSFQRRIKATTLSHRCRSAREEQPSVRRIEISRLLPTDISLHSSFYRHGEHPFIRLWMLPATRTAAKCAPLASPSVSFPKKKKIDAKRRCLVSSRLESPDIILLSAINVYNASGKCHRSWTASIRCH